MRGSPSVGVLFSSRQTVPMDELIGCAAVLASGLGHWRDTGSTAALAMGWGCTAQA